MKGEAQKTIPPLIERIEMKFTIPFSLVEPISEFASIYCSPDKYSVKSNDGYYMVNSLYFDSPEFLFVRMRMARAENRFNIRVRSYGNLPSMPYYLELKQKKGHIIRKYRAKITDPEWYKVLTLPGHDSILESDNPVEIRNSKLIERLIHSYDASPKVLTQYKRKAWVSDVDDYGRVTFDMELKYAPETEYNVAPIEYAMVSCDPEIVFDPGCSVVLELKCYAAFVPLWMIDLIKYFDLHRRGFSKYLNGVREVLGLNVYSSASVVPSYRY